MNAKQEALAQIVALADAHHISIAELTSALGRREIDANKKDAFTLTKVFSYLGGIFILAGLSAFIGLLWEELNSAARIIITLGSGIACFTMAYTKAVHDTGRSHITVWVVLSALLQTTGLFVAVYEFSTGGGDVRVAALLIFGVLAAQYGLCFAQVKRTSFLFFCVCFGLSAFVNLCDLLHVPYEVITFICGATLLALSYGIQRTPYNSMCGFGYFVGSIALLWVGFDVLSGSAVEIAYVAIAGFMLYVSTIVASRSMLITSVLALFSYISYFTAKHFADSLGWPLCLILLGGAFFGIGRLALKLNTQLATQKIGGHEVPSP
jgi:Predicted membrane protein (DUF2157)